MAGSKDYWAVALAEARREAVPASSSSSRRRASELEQRFESLKATLDPADGLRIAWPKKAAKIDGDLTFEAVQEIGLAHGLSTTRAARSTSVTGASLRLSAHGSAVKSWALRGDPRSCSQRIICGSMPRASARSRVSCWKRTMSTTMASARGARRSRARRARIASSARSAARVSPSRTKHHAKDRSLPGDRAELLGVVRLGGDMRTLAELEHGLQRRRRIAPCAGDDEATCCNAPSGSASSSRKTRAARPASPPPGALVRRRPRHGSWRCGSSFLDRGVATTT